MTKELPFNGRTRYVLRRNAEGRGPWRVLTLIPLPTDDADNVFTGFTQAKAEADARNGKYQDARRKTVLFKVRSGTCWFQFTPSEQHYIVELLNDHLLWPLIHHAPPEFTPAHQPSFVIVTVLSDKRLAAISSESPDDPKVIVLSRRLMFHDMSESLAIHYFNKEDR